MKYFTYSQQGKQAVGAVIDGDHIDITTAFRAQGHTETSLQMIDLIKQNDDEQKLAAFIREGARKDPTSLINIDHIQWEPCLPQPEKILCIGLNYKKHADETKAAYPEQPIVFSKFNNALTGHQQQIAVPAKTERLDYEVELAVIIGHEGKYITEDHALDYVFGYCSANDLSARDLQKRTPQWLIGKTCDDLCPTGPYLVSAAEVGDPQQLQLSTTVNGETRQNSNTTDMIFPVKTLVSYISQHMTLKPGDMILTGTPEGVIIGQPREKRVYLQPGDEVTVEVEKLGALNNTFIPDQ